MTNWREIARRIEEESDPEEMLELCRELIASYDKENVLGKLGDVKKKSHIPSPNPEP